MKDITVLQRAVINNNFAQHELNGVQSARCALLRRLGKELAAGIVANCPAGREQSLAMTKLEESIFWGNAAIARNGETDD